MREMLLAFWNEKSHASKILPGLLSIHPSKSVVEALIFHIVTLKLLSEMEESPTALEILKLKP
jgi:hypothetical protein